MSNLHILELRLNVPALLGLLTTQGVPAAAPDDDLGYGVHVWLAAAFGPLAPKPWRLFMDRRRPARILAYSPHPAEKLQRHLQEFADPSAFAVCPPEGIASRTMPSWSPGRLLAFELLCCPVGRKSRTGVEKDYFLLAADQTETALSRDEVYRRWLTQQLERTHAATVTGVRVAGFRLVRMTRRGNGSGGHRPHRSLRRPQVLLRGQLTVQDPEAFTQLLARGVGRHRAFGYGMLLLRPPQ